MPAVGAAIGLASTWFAATSIGVFIATPLGSLLASTAFSLASRALQRAQAGKQRRPGISTEYTTDGGTRPQSFVLGWYATAGHMVCPPMSHGKVGDRDNGYLTYVVNLGDVPGQVLNRVIIDDLVVEFAPQEASQPVGGAPPAGKPAWWYQQQGLNPADLALGLAVAPYGRPALDRHAGKVWLRYHDGRQLEADPYLLQVYGEGTPWAARSSRPWTADMVGIGTCYAVLTFKYDEKLFRGGLPRCRFEMDGIPLYDPRRDTSVGGNGTQRAADPASWAPSRNAAVIGYNILRGIPVAGGPVWGLGVPAGDLPLAGWTPAMTECDAITGTLPRWQAGLEVAVDAEPLEVLAEILKVCAGQLAEIGGRWKMRVGPPAAPVYMLTDAEIVASDAGTFVPFPGLDETYNGVQASYPEPQNLWEAKDAPARYNAAWEAADQGRRRVAELSLPACPWRGQVQQIMRAYIEEERRWRRHRLTLPPDALILEPLDVIAWSSAENGYEAKLFEVQSVSEDLASGCVTVDLQERDPADYEWRPEFELPSTAPGAVGPAVDDTAPQYFTAEGLLLAASGTSAQRPAVRLRWGGWGAEGYPAMIHEIRQGSEVIARGLIPDPEAGQHIVAAGILPGTAYQARISFQDRSGAPAAWSGWTAFTTPAARIGRDEIDDTPPAKVTGVTLSTALGSVTASWAAMADAAVYDLEITEGGGNPITASTPQTSHRWAAPPNVAWSVRVRAVDRVGNRGLWSAPAAITSARDTVPPAVPTGLAVTGGFGALWAKWNANSDADLAGYEVHISASTTAPGAGTAPTAAMMSTTMTLSGLDGGQTRHFWLRAFDASGNRSAWGPRVAATTLVMDTAVTNADLAGLIDASSFAAGIEPIKVVTALPTTRQTSSIYYSNKLYRWDVAAGKYTAEVAADEVVGKLTAGQIAAAAIGVDQLAAGSIVASKLAIADFTNLVPDDQIQDVNAWVKTTGGGWVHEPTTPRSDVRSVGNWRYKNTEHTAAGDSVCYIKGFFPVGPGDELFLSGQMIRSGGSKMRVLCQILYYDKNDALLAAGGAYSFASVNGASNTAADYIGEHIVPAGAMQARFRFYVYKAETDCYVTFASPTVRIKNKGHMIVDGALAARHMKADELIITGSAQLANAIIKDAHITTLNAEKLVAGTTLSGSIRVDGTALTSVKEGAAEGAKDPAGRINTGSTLIDPGRILISGTRTIADWRKGGDETRIDGGALSANTVRGNALEIGSRNITLTGVQFEHNSPSANRVSWTAGRVRWLNDAGNIETTLITASAAVWTAGVLYIYWRKGIANFLATTDLNVAMATNNVCFATYEGGTWLDADYGRTIVDGAHIKTGTLDASALVKTRALITEVAQMGTATVDTLSIAGNAVTVPTFFQNKNAFTSSASWTNIFNQAVAIGVGNRANVITNSSVGWPTGSAFVSNTWYYELLMNGVVVYETSGRLMHDTMSLSGSSLANSAGNIIATLRVRTTSTEVLVHNQSAMTILGVKR